MTAELADRHVLYRMFAADGGLLYVGLTRNPYARFKGHQPKDWFPQVSTITVEHFDSREALVIAEAAAIRAEQPIHNVIFGPKPTRDSLTIHLQPGAPERLQDLASTTRVDKLAELLDMSPSNLSRALRGQISVGTTFLAGVILWLGWDYIIEHFDDLFEIRSTESAA